MKRLLIFLLTFLTISSTCVFSQESDPNSKGFYLGIDIGRGRVPVFYESFEGTMFHYPNVPTHRNYWVDPADPEGKPKLSFGGKFGMFLSKPTSDIQLLGEFGFEYFSIEYTDKDYYYSSSCHKASLEEFDYTVSSINLIPKLKVSSRITSSLRGYMGFGVSLSLLKLNEKHDSWNYNDDLNLEWSYSFNETSNITKVGLNPFLGVEWKLNTFSFYLEYDYLYIPKIEFEFDKATKSGKVENYLGSIEWEVEKGKREIYFEIPSTNLKFGISIYL